MRMVDRLVPVRWRRPLLLAGSGLLALYAGFVAFSASECEALVRRVGYGWTLALLAGLAWALRGVIHERGGWRPAWGAVRPDRGSAVLILFVWLWLLRMDSPGYKVLYDEPVQAATAYTLHTEREFSTTARAFNVGGLFTILQTYVDKRPPVFPVLVSLVHDLTGYRPGNALAVNAAGALALVWLVWWLGRRAGAGAPAGRSALALLATIPIVGINVTSLGMDLINLTVLAAWTAAVVLYLARSSSTRLGLLAAITLVLAYCRYESVLYVGVTGLVWLVVAWRDRQWRWEPVLAVVPLALLLYAWHNTMLSSRPELWELRPEQTQRFSLAYAANNLSHAWAFFFTPGWRLPNSPLLAVLGVAGGLVTLAAWRRCRREELALGALALGALSNLGLVICYYWGELDDPIVSRLSLPAYLVLILAVVSGWRLVAVRLASAPGWRPIQAAALLALVVFTVPNVAADLTTGPNLVRRNYEWESRVVNAHWPKPGLLIANRSTMCWLAEGLPAITIERARAREALVAWHLDRHSFGTVLVLQRVVTLGGRGGWLVDAGEQVPAHWQLEEVAVKRIGLTLTRISRVVAIPPSVAVRAEHPASGEDFRL